MIRRVLIAFSVLVLVMLAPVSLNVWMAHLIQKSAHIQLDGRVEPSWWRTSFRITDGGFTWQDKVRLTSGKVWIDYSLLSLLAGHGIRVKVKGSSLETRLLGSWAREEGVEELPIDRLEADFSLNGGGVRDIYRLAVESPVLQFHIAESNK